MPQSAPWRHALGVLVVLALSAATYCSLRLACADHLGRQPSTDAVRRAIRLAPGDSRHYRKWAAVEPAGRAAALERAVAANPRDSAAWILLGLEAEARGDDPRAERCLLEAARVDRTLEPRWTLANYYFRRDRTGQFWRWAREAAAMAHGDVTALFRLCWKVAPEPAAILGRIRPDRPLVLQQFLSFLLAQDHLEGAETVARRILEAASPEDAPPLVAYCDRLLETGRAEAAVRIWNGLASRKLIGFRPLAPEAGQVLTDGDFSGARLGSGFDWRFPRVTGVAVARSPSPPSMRFSFSGRQPESCVILSQFVPLQAGASYRLSYRYRTVGIPAASGVAWQVAGARSAPLSGEDWTEESLAFVAAPDAPRRLALSYQRAPGTTRIEGTLWISQVRLEPALD